MEKSSFSSDNNIENHEKEVMENNQDDVNIFDTLFESTQEQDSANLNSSSNNVVLAFNYEDLDDLNIGVIVVDSQGLIKYFNKEIRRLGEFGDIDIIGLDLLSVYGQMNVRDMYTNSEPVYDMEKVLTTGSNRYSNIKAFNKITTPTGKVRIVQSMMLPIKENNGFGFVMIINDTEKRESNETIINTEESFVKILSLSPIAVLVIDYDTSNIYSCNKAFTNLTGYTSDELQGISIENFQLWSNENEKYNFLELLYNHKEILNLSTEVKSKDNKDVFCELSASIINYNNKKYLIVYLVDITSKVISEQERTKLLNELENKVSKQKSELIEVNNSLNQQISYRENSEKKLEFSIEKYSSLLEHLPVGVYRIDMNGNYLECNPALFDITGYDSLEDVNLSSNKKYIRDSIDFDPNKMDNKHSYHTEIKYIRKDGTSLWLNNVYTKSVDEKGEEMIDGVIFDITSEKLANENIYKSELKYRKLFENLVDIYIYIDIDGNIQNISPSFEQATGFNVKNMINKHISMTLNDNIKNHEFLTSFKKITSSYVYTISFKNFINSEQNFYSLNLQTDYDLEGNIVGYEGLARDITKDIEHSNKVSALFDIANAVNETVSLDELYKYIHQTIGKVIFSNNFYIALVNKELNCIYFPYFVDEIDEKFEGTISLDIKHSKTVDLIKSKKPLVYQFDPSDKELLDKAIGSIALSWMGVPLKLRGEVIGAIVVQSYSNINQFDESHEKFLQAISDQIALAIERKNSQINLDTQLDFISRLVDNIPYPLYYKEINSLKYKLTNEAYAKLLKLEKKEIIGKTFYEIEEKIKENIKYETNNDFDEELIMKGDSQVYEETIIIDGVEKQLLNLKNCFYNSENAMEGIIGVIVDISEQKKATKAIEESLDKEKQLNELKNKFISIVSHEFRTPLQSILLSVELLQEYSHKMDAADKKIQYDRIKKSISSLNMLMEDVLLINKSERGTIQFNPSLIDIAKLIKDLTNNLKFLLKNNVQLELIIDKDKAEVMIDESLVKLVLNNIINNAIKYSKPNTTVTIEAKINDEKTLISVKDQGIGIPKSEQQQMFKPFHRFSNVGTIAGTGLGLSIVYDTVKKFNGDINFTSEENVGTTFNVVIPHSK